MDTEIEDELDTNADAAPSIRDSLMQAVSDNAELPDVETVVVTDAAEPVEGETQEQADQRARDEAGRFAKAAKKPAEKPVAAVKPVVSVKPALKQGAQPLAPGAKPGTVPTSAQAPAAVEMKPPQSFRGPAKEAWAQVPEPVRVEVLRREKEIATQLTGLAEERKYASTMKQAFAPFEQQIRAEGSTPEAAIGKLMNTAMALRTAPPAHKAQLVADMIMDFGIPLQPLVDALSGRQPAPGQQPQQQAQQFDPATIAQQVKQQLMKDLGTQRDAHLVKKFEAETDTFLGDKAMHGLDGSDYSQEIRESMADIIERATDRGLKITLERAYSLAAREHPEVSKVLEQKERAAGAVKANASTQRARVAASSVRHESATQPVSKGDASDLRSTLRKAMDANSER